MSSKRTKSTQFELAKLTAKRDLYYSEMEELYKLSLRIDEPTVKDKFLTFFRGFSDTHKKFLDILDSVNDLNFQIDPEFKPDYKMLKGVSRFQCSIIDAAERLNKNSGHTDVSPQSSFKLPRITLPEFDGEISQWPLFFEKFNTIIHNNPSLDNLAKLHYLLGSLKGKALDVCAGFTPTAANYPILLDALKTRYDNKRFLANTFSEQMLDLKPLSQESVPALNNLILRFDTAYKSFQRLQLPDPLDTHMANLLLRKLDPSTRRAFETSAHTSIPSYEEVLKFARRHIEALSQLPKTKIITKSSGNTVSPHLPCKSLVNQVTPSNSSKKETPKIPQCPICTQSHQIFKCQAFAKLTPSERLRRAQDGNWCVNCLSHSHVTQACKSRFSCKMCNNAHHTLLHIDNPVKNVSSPNPLPHAEEKPACNFFTNSLSESSEPAVNNKVTILPTAVVLIQTPFGDKTARFLIDSGSQRHFLSHACCKKLHLPYRKRSVPLEGMGNVPLQAIGVTEFTIKSQINPTVNFKISALVTEKITRYLPPETVCVEKLRYLKNLPLADKNFFHPGRIDGILGAQLFGKIFTGATVTAPDGTTQALSTSLGHIIMGDASKRKSSCTSEDSSITTLCVFDNQELLQAVQRFWELEEVPRNPKLCKEDKFCEELFLTTTHRIDGRRYCVELPFREFPPELGDSREMAENRFYSLERKFKRNPEFRSQYTAVIQDYKDQGHLTPASESSTSADNTHFIPHFAVLKESSSTPLRIVFDASAKTSNGRSLNDVLYTGPKLQTDISKVLMSFRSSSIALIADIRQMYRNIAVHNKHRRFQQILWRESSQKPLQTLQLNCVVFGVTSAPYLALRTVQQLAQDEAVNFPLAAQLANQHMYVDDLVVSLDSVPAAVEAYKQLVGLFTAGGFKLTKWASNSPELLEAIPAEDRVVQSIEFQDSSKMNETLKVLGLIWDPASDTLSFKINAFEPKFTKRGILSVVARIWDPLGFLAPMTLHAKLIIKELWDHGFDWDEEISFDLRRRWQLFLEQLPRLHDVQIPRHFGTVCGDSITLVGFADSSEKGYGAVVYLRFNKVIPTVRILFAKSRVAPKKTVTIPKLELCAAVLLSELTNVCVEALSPSFSKITKIALTDSTVTLAWLKNDTLKRETFVANRITVIERTLSPGSWFHVRSEDNIADHISRGLLPDEIVTQESWLHGPPWLRLEFEAWPISADNFQPSMSTESPNSSFNNVVALLNISLKEEKEEFEQFLCRFSSLKRLLHVTVRLLSFCKRLPIQGKPDRTSLEFAERVIIRQLQRHHFAEDLAKIKNNELCSPQLRCLSPFLEGDIIRVGGRLSHSKLSYDTKHPILLPKKSHFSTLVINDCHISNFHTGPNLVFAILRQRFWILSARNLIRKQLNSCNFCFKLKPRPIYPPMADLPPARVLEAKPFLHTGVDYAGPFQISISRRRGVKSQKAYLCLFICLATKAVHLELASDLSSDTFLACFKRFVSRRGPISCLYSDRGTNFIGAKAELDAIHAFLQSNQFLDPLHDYLENRRIEWKFNPPHAPHFGGIWEANIRSVKSHLSKVIGTQILSYEEFNTVLTQIEALLNSRPLCQSSSDPGEPSALTPAHFLTLTPLRSLPLTNADNSTSLHTRKELLDAIVRSFWKRWHTEYLVSLQPRKKWNSTTDSLKIGTVVVVIHESTPPLQWPLAIVEEVHPGPDGVIRVATVRIGKNLYQRPVVKLCPLPSQYLGLDLGEKTQH